jgi:hypothetical protein
VTGCFTVRPTEHSESTPRIQPAGERWGFGSDSVVPYLTMSLHLRPAGGPRDADTSIRNPVFPQMDTTLRVALRQRN